MERKGQRVSLGGHKARPSLPGKGSLSGQKSANIISLMLEQIILPSFQNWLGGGKGKGPKSLWECHRPSLPCSSLQGHRDKCHQQFQGHLTLKLSHRQHGKDSCWKNWLVPSAKSWAMLSPTPTIPYSPFQQVTSQMTTNHPNMTSANHPI